MILSALLSIGLLLSQTPAKAPPTTESLVDQWFIRLNALDEWFISMNGKEETDPVVNRFAELYDADAYHEVQPSENQLGPVVFHGPEGIRHWATDFAKKYVQLAYRIDFMTRSEKPTQLFYTVKPPWGGSAAAVEFSAVWTDRQSRKRYLMPGSAFFLFNDAGKILRVRMYMLKDLAVEIQ